MKQIADAVSSLPDEASRVRVLRWVAERLASFSETRIAVPLSAPLRAPSLLTAVAAPFCTRPPADPALALDGIEAMFDEPRDLIIAGVGEGGPSPATEATISMVDGFVKEFQKLAREWEGA
jgi:hypothetical protein